MADIIISQGQSLSMTMHSRWEDMGDGTHALVMSLGGAVITVTGGLTDTELRATAVPVTAVLTAGEAHAGQVGGEGATAVQIPAITAGAYSANDAVGGLLTFVNIARISGDGVILTNVNIVDDGGLDAELELWLFDQTFTAMADNAAWAPSEADLENWIGTISTADSAQGWLDAGTPSAIDIEVTKRLDLVGTSLFGQLVTRGTPTFIAVDDITVKVAVLQD